MRELSLVALVCAVFALAPIAAALNCTFASTDITEPDSFKAALAERVVGGEIVLITLVITSAPQPPILWTVILFTPDYF